MSIKPILFNTEMVQAILDGRKTQTRRIVKTTDGIPLHSYSDNAAKRFLFHGCNVKKAPCEPGDILWVREAWAQYKNGSRYIYRVDSDGRCAAAYYNEHGNREARWRPSIHMPKDAARIFLRVKDVRVERLMDMSEADCIAEGIREFTKDGKLFKYATQSGDMPSVPWQDMPENPKHAFFDLWNSTINPADREQYGWLASPWVWVISFERCEKPEGWEG